MRIAIAGFGTESTMFAQYRTPFEFFHQHRGADLMALYDVATLLGDRGEGIEWLPTVRFQGAAGGPVEPEAFDRIVDELVAELAALGPIDGLYFDLHGAAHVDGRDHAEEVLFRRIRAAIGDDVVISASMDPHGNFSRELASLVDLSSPHRHSPHIDNQATRLRAISNLVDVLIRGEKPLKAWVRVPLLLPGERTSTTVEPGATVYGLAQPASELDGIVDAGMWVGFAWADEDRNAAAVMVTGWDAQQITEVAARLAQAYWDARDGFVIVTAHSGSWSEALDFSLTDDATGQLWIADAGDNVTAGASGDITFALTETLARQDVLDSGRKWVFEGIVDPDAVAAAAELGVGGVLERAIGAGVDTRYAAPVGGPWTVVELVDGFFGEGVVAAVVTNGVVDVSLHVSRVKFTPPEDPTSIKRPGHVWHELDAYDVVVVKNGYMFPGQLARAGSTFMALTPGGTELDFDRLEFSKVQRPIFPLDRDFEPDLTPEVLPALGRATTAPATTQEV